MKLSEQDCILFYKLHQNLMFYANKKLKVLKQNIPTDEKYALLSPELRIKVHNAVQAHPEIIDRFVEENPAGLSPDELKIVSKWKYGIHQQFLVLRYLKRHAIFLGEGKAYGVLAIHNPFEELLGPYLPVFAKTVLLPFKGKIIYDGLFENLPMRLTFGGNIKREFNREYNEIKDGEGIVTTFPCDKDFEETVGKAPKPKLAEKEEPDSTVPILLTQAQRRAVAGLLPQFESRFDLDNPQGKTIHLTCEEIETIIQSCKKALPKATNGMVRNSLELAIEAGRKTLDRYQGKSIFRMPPKNRVFQVRISSRGIKPEIWRRIQIKDCTLDRLHQYIQAAMGWQDYHLYQFEINGITYSLHLIICDGWEQDYETVDTADTKLSDIIPKDGSRFAFLYGYDLGDSWQYEILFEGCLQAKKGDRYPICLEGERACPPEGVGGPDVYEEYLRILNDPKDPEYEQCLKWRGPFDSEVLDAEKITKKMRRVK